MEEVIRRIIQIEEDAQKLIDGAEQEIALQEKELDEKLKKIEKEYSEEAKKKLEAIKASEIALAQTEVDEKKRFCIGKLQEIEKLYSEHGEKWADSILKSVLKR